MSQPHPASAAGGDSHKAHRTRQAGAKFDKKKAKDKTKRELTQQHKNPRAFGFNSARAAAKAGRRTLDLSHKKQHVPIVNRAPEEPAPYLIAVVGPPGVGKTTLIKCLVKHYTKYSLQSVNGPITVISSKKRRITFFECRNDLHSMCDLAKTADLVLLLVDASFGFEMETFEFLNILKTHGFPKVMGILTHLDHFKQNKTLNKTKKKFKHRFWSEICDGAKLFYLSGLINGKYPKREVLNLSRFISVTKFRPLLWRNTHSYVVADRYEDLTNPSLLEENPKVDRRVVVYGYVRGTFLKPQQKVHVMGIGDFHMHSVEILDDPCPLKKDPVEGVKRRSLNEKEKLLYAPMSDVGDVMYDADATYINIHDKHINFSRREDIIADEEMEEATGVKQKEWKPIYDKWGNITNKQKPKFDPNTMIPSNDLDQLGEGQRIVREMQELKKNATLDVQMQESGLQFFKGSKPLLAKDFDESKGYKELDESDEEKGEDEEGNDSDLEAEDAAEGQRSSGKGSLRTREYQDASGRVRTKVLFDGETGEEEEEDGDDDDDEDEEKDEDDEELDGEEGEEEGDDDDYYNDSAPTRKEGEEEDEDVDMEDAEDGEDEDEGEEEDEDVDMNGETSENNLKWKEGLTERAAKNFGKKLNLMDLVYGNATKSNNLARLSKRKDELRLSVGGEGDEKKLSLFDSDSEDEDNAGLTNAQRASGMQDEDDEDETFFRKVGSGSKDVTNDDLDSVKFNTLSLGASSSSTTSTGRITLNQLHPTRDWTISDTFETIRNRFVTGDWSEDRGGDDDDEDEDDFGGKKRRQEDSDEEEADKAAHRKDRKNRRKLAAEEEKKSRGKGTSSTEDGEDDEDEEDGIDPNESDDDMNARLDREAGSLLGQLSSKDISVEGGSGKLAGETDEQAAIRRAKEKAALKSTFDASYDFKKKKSKEGEPDDDEPEPDFLGQWNEKQTKQSEVNNEFAQEAQTASDRLAYEGARSGTYVRIELLHVPCEFVTNFDPAYPLILGGLLPSEDNLGYMQIRLKKHRWHRKILKTNDPLIFSIGWRRFQCMPVYSMEDKNNRARFLKYTPEHMHCIATIYGPITSQGTGILAYTNSTTKLANFRISATGVILELDHTFKIVKKLKLTGYPYKIYKNCFPVADHEIFTEHGFMSYYAVLEYFKTHPTLAVGCHVGGELQFHSITKSELTVDTDTHRLVEMEGTVVTSTDVNGVVRRRSNKVSIRPTDNHRMWVRLGPGVGENRTWPQEEVIENGASRLVQRPPDFQIHEAKEILSAGENDKTTVAQFTAQFELGLVASGQPLPFVDVLRLRTDDEIDAFIEFYGYWLGDGWLEHGHIICVGPVKVQDFDYLDALFKRLVAVLPPSTVDDETITGVYIAPRPTQKGVQRSYRIYVKSWCDYFAAQYAHKYKGDQAVAYSTAAAAARGSSVPQPRYHVEHDQFIPDATPYKMNSGPQPKGGTTQCVKCEKHVSDTNQCRVKHLVVCLGVPQPLFSDSDRFVIDPVPVKPKTGPAPKGDTCECLWCHAHIATHSHSRAQHKKKCNGKKPDTESITVVKKRKIDHQLAEQISVDGAGAALPPVTSTATTTAATVGVAMVFSTDRSATPPPAEDINSAKWFWYWVWKRLGKRRLRILLAGLRYADGNQANTRNTHGGTIFTSSLRFRDEIVRVCLAAGYSVTFAIGVEKGATCGSNGIQATATSTAWRISYTEDTKMAQPKISVARECRAVNETGTVWCVTVPTPDQLIMVRRVLTKDAATGEVIDASRPVVVGNTAYIKDMFTSALEVAKFEGAAIKTVSGIRGQIKKAVTTEGKDGIFRATFEDKILASDIVFCRTWTSIQPQKYYNPVSSLLYRNKNAWQGMRTIAQIRADEQLRVPYKPDSNYKPIERFKKTFNPLHIPAKLQANLPFASKPKLFKAKRQRAPTYLESRPSVIDPHEKKVNTLVQQLQTIRNVKDAKRKESKLKAREVHLKKLDQEAAKHAGHNKEVRKRKIIAEEQGRHVKQKRYTDK